MHGQWDRDRGKPVCLGVDELHGLTESIFTSLLLDLWCLRPEAMRYRTDIKNARLCPST